MPCVAHWAALDSRACPPNVHPGRSRSAHVGACLALLFGVLNGGPAWSGEGDESLIEIVVTGSRLSSANASSPSPIVVLDSEELQHQGAVRTEDFLNSLPQVNSGLTLGANGPSVSPLTGTATADLRGIGAFRTLVLVNSKRAAPGDPINPSADLNTVPSTLMKAAQTFYEAQVNRLGKKSEVKVDASGQPIK